MRYVSEVTITRQKFVFFILISSFLLGCGGQGGGNAPSASVLPRPPGSGIGSEGIFKYGQTLSTTNGWTVTMDHTDPVETVNLTNGWTVEVLHE